MEKITEDLTRSTVHTSEVRAWEETVLLPTYGIGREEKNPIFLEKRVYQGSSGSVYPYPVVEKIEDEKHNRPYRAFFLENEYIKVMILPELGGRVHMAYDKVKQRHFVYYNQVVKPALVGLTGPWISGGIEFNWPQHHRPSTFLPTDCTIEEFPDGSKPYGAAKWSACSAPRAWPASRFIRAKPILKSREKCTTALLSRKRSCGGPIRP